MQKQSPIHQLISHFQESFVRLHLDIPPKICERYAVFIHNCMDNGKRKFHTTHHVLDVCRNMKPLQVLAGLFHDVVYYQVDGGFLPEFAELVQQIVVVKDKKVVLSDTLPDNPLVNICLDVFDFSPGQVLGIHKGLNEFLSAWIALNYLDQFLKAKDLITIAACIEATIPFRPKDTEGLTCFDHLKHRITACFTKYHLDLTTAQINEMVTLAAGLSIRDVINFADEDARRFLDNTWVLLPETNAMLWLPGVYSNGDYRKALTKMESFLTFLNPENVFHQYKGYPNSQELELMEQQAHKNIQIANEYLQIKILTIAIIEALAIATGGDGPMSLFLGDVRMYNEIERIEDYFPPIELSDELEYNDNLYRLFEYGRENETSFDLKNSPVASFVYKLLGDEQAKASVTLARKMFAEEISPETFLRSLNRELVSHIAQACAMMVTTRRKEMIKWA